MKASAATRISLAAKGVLALRSSTYPQVRLRRSGLRAPFSLSDMRISLEPFTNFPGYTSSVPSLIPSKRIVE